MSAALQASRNRLSVALNATRKKTNMLEDIVAEKDDALVEAFDCLTRALSEYKNLQKLSQGASAGVQFGVSQDDALRKLLILQERIEFMHEVCQSERYGIQSCIAGPAVCASAEHGHIILLWICQWYGCIQLFRKLSSSLRKRNAVTSSLPCRG